jgi:hypothetical protein
VSDKTASRRPARAGSLKGLTQTALLLALALGLQSLHLPQVITGAVINSVLLVAAVLVTPWGGATIGLLTPVTALLLGQLNPILAPAIPFIMAANAGFALVFGFGRKVNLYLAAVLAACLKFGLLAAAVRFVLALPKPVTVALQVPQLVTALAGVGVAVLALEALAAAGVVSREQWPGLSARAPRRQGRRGR